MPKSPDAFRTISEVADWLGTPTHVLRFWESRFSQVKPVKRAGGRRYYRPSDMALLGGIKRLLHDDGMTIRGVQKILREKGVKHVASLSQSLELDEEAPFEADAVEAVPVDNVVSLPGRDPVEPEAPAREAVAVAVEPEPEPKSEPVSKRPEPVDRDAALAPEQPAPDAVESVSERARTDAPRTPATPAPESEHEDAAEHSPRAPAGAETPPAEPEPDRPGVAAEQQRPPGATEVPLFARSRPVTPTPAPGPVEPSPADAAAEAPAPDEPREPEMPEPADPTPDVAEPVAPEPADAAPLNGEPLVLSHPQAPAAGPADAPRDVAPPKPARVWAEADGSGDEPSLAEDIVALLAAGARPDPAALRPSYDRLVELRQRMTANR